MVKIMKLIAMLAAVAYLFGCKAPEPEMLDGPGMVCSDNENCED